MFRIFFFLLPLLPFSAAIPSGQHRRDGSDPYVELPDYGAFQGIRLASKIDAWLGIEYASQPVGQNRFTRVSWPGKFSGVRKATEYGPACIQGAKASPTQSEACLVLNVYRPSGIPMESKLPVLVWIHGGGFSGGSGRSFDGETFVSRSYRPVMVVSINYRLASLGSLPSKLFEKEGILNLGLLDQRQALEFVHRYISQFGGDPDHVTVGGQSAGGHSVGVHYFHNYGSDSGKPLFSQAIMASGSVTARAFPPVDYPLSQKQFQQYMAYLKCPTNDNATAMTCLRKADIADIRYIQDKMTGDSQYNITWPFQPVGGGPLLETPGSVSGIEKKFFHLPLITSSTTDEGKAFAPKNLDTDAQVEKFLRNLAPGLTNNDVGDLARLYPSPDNNNSPYKDSPKSKQFNRISAAYGDYSYICPVQETAYRVASAGVPVWKARFNTPNGSPEWQGVTHGADVDYFTGKPNTQFPDVSELYHAYFASFVATGNPNTYAIRGTPNWSPYFGWNNNEAAQQLVVNPQGKSTMEWETNGIREEQCAWWRNPDRMRRLNK